MTETETCQQYQAWRDMPGSICFISECHYYDWYQYMCLAPEGEFSGQYCPWRGYPTKDEKIGETINA